MNDDRKTESTAPARMGTTVLRVGLPVLLIAAAAILVWWMMRTEPRAGRRAPVRQATLVEVQDVTVTEEAAVVQAMGTVIAAKQVDVHPQVRGEIIKMNPEFAPGGLFKKGDLMARIDPADYKLAIEQINASVVQAQSELRVEQGSQNIAQKEYEMLGEVVTEEDRDLVLRKPQFDKAEASLKSTRAALGKAKLDLTRTRIMAPFNAVVQRRGVDLGARVTESSVLATLVGTDAYWIEISVPVDHLKWIRVPKSSAETGSVVRVYDESAWGPGVFRIGHVARLKAALEEKGRMARIIARVSDPLGLLTENEDSPRLLIGSYVRVEIEGMNLSKVVPIPRRLLRDDQTVWVMTEEGKLDIRKVEVAFQRPDQVYLSSGILAGEKLVITNLSTPVNGMSIRVFDPNKKRSRP